MDDPHSRQRGDQEQKETVSSKEFHPLFNPPSLDSPFDHIFSFDSEYESYLHPSNSTVNDLKTSLDSLRQFESSGAKSSLSNQIPGSNVIRETIESSNKSFHERLQNKVPGEERLHSSSLYSLNSRGYKPAPILAHSNFEEPQRDSDRLPSSRNVSLDLSVTNPFESSTPTLVENLLESPNDTFLSFQEAQLRFDSVTSDSETSELQLYEKNGPVRWDDRHLRSAFESLGKEQDKHFSHSTPKERAKYKKLKEEKQDFGLNTNSRVLNCISMEGDGSFSTQFDMYAMDGNMAVHPDIDDTPYPQDSYTSPIPDRMLHPDQLRAPSSTEEAIALQRAVIGSGSASKSASMDEINAAIAAVEKQYRERLNNLGERRQLNFEEEDGAGLNLMGKAKDFHVSCNSLDETPTKLPAPHKGAKDQDSIESHQAILHNSRPTSKGHSPSDQATVEQLQRSGPKDHLDPGYSRSKSSSLPTQNAHSHVKDAVVARSNTSPAASVVTASFTPKGQSQGRVLFRSPIEGVPTHRGGKTVVVPKSVNQRGDTGAEHVPVKDTSRGYAEDLQAHHSLPNGVLPSRVTSDSYRKCENVPLSGFANELPVKMKSAPEDSSANGYSVVDSGVNSNSPSQIEEKPKEAYKTSGSSRRIASYTPTPIFPVRKRDLNKMPSTSLNQMKSAVPQSSSDSMEVLDLLREKAKLEGQLETLLAESEAALQARAELQSQVASLQAQLKTLNAAIDQADEEKSSLENNLAMLRSDRTQLEDKVVSLENSLEVKENSLENARRDLENSVSNNQRMQVRLEELRNDIESRELSIARLRKKVETLANELETSQQDQSQPTSDVRSLEAELISTQKTKDYFQEQLQLAQDTRNKLQKELSESQDKVRGQASVIEVLRTENTQMNLALSETRQQALQEKEQIAKHLETIEADILAREAAFVEMQREKSAVHDAVIAQMDQMEMEKHKVANLVASAVELERQLEVAQKELTDKKNRLFEVENEKKELVKEHTTAKEQLSTKERELEASQVKCKDAEARLQEKQAQSAKLEEELGQLRSDKVALEAALITANEEKRKFDTALQSLREDMEKVEKKFKQMKQDVAKKDEELEVAKKRGELAQDRVLGLEEQLREEQRNVEGYASVLGTKDAQLKELEQSNKALQGEISAIQRELLVQQETANSSQRSLGQAQAELQLAKENIHSLEQHIQDTSVQTANLQGQLESLSSEKERYSQLLNENDILKQNLAEAKSTNHREIAEQKAKVLRLTSDLSSAQRELKDRQKCHNETVEELGLRLRQAENAKELLENTLQNAQSAAAEMTKAEQLKLQEQLQKAQDDSQMLDKAKANLKQEIEDLQTRHAADVNAYEAQMQQLEAQNQELQQELDMLLSNEEVNKKLAIELERERGRLTGLQKSHAALKQHTQALEEALAMRESSMTELSAHLNSNSHERLTEEDKLNQKLVELEAAVNREKLMSKELRKQLATEKGNCRRAKEQIQAQSVEIQESQENLEKSLSDLQATHGTVEELKRTEQAQKTQLESKRKELEQMKAQLEHLQRQLQNNISQNPMLEDQMQTLTFENEQKTLELQGMKEQMELAEKRQKLESDGMKNNLQMNKKELECLKRELALTRKEKFASQAKLGQLKAALKATVQQNKLLKAKLKAKKTQEVQNNPAAVTVDEIVVPEMAYDVESLLVSDDVGSLGTGESKPLQALQGCLQSIKSQMGVLEKQLEEHTAAVNSSSEAWKEVESRVRDLRKACDSPVVSKVPLGTQQAVSGQSRGSTQISGPSQSKSKPESSLSAPTLPNVYEL